VPLGGTGFRNHKLVGNHSGLNYYQKYEYPVNQPLGIRKILDYYLVLYILNCQRGFAGIIDKENTQSEKST
jgi:hypothetical protein